MQSRQEEKSILTQRTPVNGYLDLRPSSTEDHLPLTTADIPELLTFLQNHPEITYVNLDGNQIDDNGAILLAEYTELPGLSINDNQLTDRGAEAFLQNTTLTNFECRNEGISEPLRQPLRDMSIRNNYWQIGEKKKVNTILQDFIPIVLANVVWEYITTISPPSRIGRNPAGIPDETPVIKMNLSALFSLDSLAFQVNNISTNPIIAAILPPSGTQPEQPRGSALADNPLILLNQIHAKPWNENSAREVLRNATILDDKATGSTIIRIDPTLKLSGLHKSILYQVLHSLVGQAQQSPAITINGTMIIVGNMMRKDLLKLLCGESKNSWFLRNN